MKSPVIAISFLIISLCYSKLGNTQCTVTAYASQDTVCAGEAVYLSAQYSCDSSIMYIGFNSGELGPDVDATTGVMFSHPCDTVLPAGLHCWIGSYTNFPRFVSTKAMNISSNSTVSFLMRYAADENAVDCEDPDEVTEGVHLQYSKSPYTTWVDIEYWTPNWSYSGPLYSWNSYYITIPAAATGTSTKLRWYQNFTSGNNWDHWGIDELRINNTSVTSVVWSNGVTGFGTQPVYPTHDTSFIVTVTDTAAGITVSDTVFIEVLNDATEIFASDCFSYLAPDSSFITATGTYLYHFPDSGSCDSVVAVHFTLITPDISVISDLSTLTAVDSTSMYQWVTCPNYTIIPGETNQSFTPATSGQYACILTHMGCTDTTLCYNAYPAGILENTFGSSISVYPNPTQGNIIVDFDETIDIMKIAVRELSGKLISEETYSNTKHIELNIDAEPGIYFMTIQSPQGNALLKIVKE